LQGECVNQQALSNSAHGIPKGFDGQLFEVCNPWLPRDRRGSGQSDLHTIRNDEESVAFVAKRRPM